jgi:chemosensory pili system protein ChpA (sensor histidine kinase/response regulator)
MNQSFDIKGISPATGRVVEITLLAPSELDARMQAENAGLQQVTVSVRAAEPVAEGAKRAGTPLILVVDDHEDVRFLLMRMLRDEGYASMGASNGEEALATMAGSKPALVIMDLNMPRMNGLEAIKRMRGDADLRDVPVIMFSASGREASIEAMRVGANAFVEKDTMDWPKLRGEVRRLAGPGLGETRLPEMRGKENRNAS